MEQNTMERRAAKKQIPGKYIVIGIVIAGIIIFAFIWEAVLGNMPDTGGLPTDNPVIAQTELERQDWVTPAFLPLNKYSRPGTPVTKINAVVIHYVGNPGTTAAQNRSYFANLAMSGETYSSSNFLIGLDGEIIQCVPINEVAYCSNKRNDDTVSIECCHPDAEGEFSEATYESAVRLTAWLISSLDLTTDDIIRHYDVTGKECPLYYVNNEAAWIQFKADVGREITAMESVE